MDVEQFDRIAKVLGRGASRRRLLRLGSALLPGGLLAAWQREAAGAERPHERLARRTQQRNRKQRTQRQQNQNQNNNNGGGGNGGGGGGGNGGGGGGNGGGGNDNTNSNRNDNTLGSGLQRCGTGQACPSGQVCLSGACFTTCPGPFSCLGGSGGCQPDAACQQTTSGTAVCTTGTTSDSCTTDADCGLWSVCIQNPSNPSCQGNAPTYCAVNS